MKKTHSGLFGALIGAFIALPFFAFAAPMSPLATTLAPSSVTEKSAHFEGRTNGGEIADARAWFEWGLASDPTKYWETPRRTVGGGLTNFSFEENGMAPETNYFVRLVIESTRGRDQGQTTYFQTKNLPVTNTGTVIVITLDPTGVDHTTATLHGYVAPHGATSARAGFAWGPTVALENETPEVGASGASREYTQVIRNLEPGTIYYFRAVSSGSATQNQGALKWFLTPGTAPAGAGMQNTNTNMTTHSNSGSGSVLGASIGGGTNAATPIPAAPGAVGVVGADPQAATAKVTLSYEGAPAAGARLGVEWGTTRSLGNDRDFMTVVGTGQAYTAIAGLTSCTIYYYRGTLTAGGGKKMTAIDSFTTKGGFANSACTAPATGSQVASVGAAGSSGATGTTTTGARGVGWQMPKWQPQPIFGIPFPGTKIENTTNGEVAGTGTIHGSTRTDSSSGFFDRFFSGITGDKPLSVSVDTVDGKGGPHEPVEYRIAYNYTGDTPLNNAVLKVIFPKEVVYIGDNTANEFYLMDVPDDPERTYLLPLGTLTKGSNRTVTMLGMTIADAPGNNKILPTARARVEFADPSGSGMAAVAAINPNAAPENKPSTAKDNGSILPSSLVGWLFFILATVATFTGVKKARAYYDVRKKEIAEEEEDVRGGRMQTENTRTLASLYADPSEDLAPAMSGGNGAAYSVEDDRDPVTGVTAELFAQLPR